MQLGCREAGALWHSVRRLICHSSGTAAAAQSRHIAYLRPASPPPPPPAPHSFHRRSTSTRAGTRTVHAMAAALDPRAQAVLDYWFGPGWETAPPDDSRPQQMKVWFMGGPEVDAEIVRLFGGDCEALLAGTYDGWQQGPAAEALSGILIGDQLFRNAYRGTSKMYAADGNVLGWTKGLLESGADRQLAPIQRVFAYMPLMHSEALADQEECVARFERLAAECEAGGLQAMAKMAGQNVQYAASHRDVVARWGRFPHRNAILGRQSTPEEAEGIAAGTIPKW